MGDITAPVILGPSGQEIQSVPWDLVTAVDRCDDLLRRYGMQMQIICETCFERGHPAPYVQGDNSRNSTIWKMTCPHCERRYNFTIS